MLRQVDWGRSTGKLSAKARNNGAWGGQALATSGKSNQTEHGRSRFLCHRAQREIAIAFNGKREGGKVNV